MICSASSPTECPQDGITGCCAPRGSCSVSFLGFTVLFSDIVSQHLTKMDHISSLRGTADLLLLMLIHCGGGANCTCSAAKEKMVTGNDEVEVSVLSNEMQQRELKVPSADTQVAKYLLKTTFKVRPNIVLRRSLELFLLPICRGRA